jgi:ParB/RepB/Spo0J family partition protein
LAPSPLTTGKRFTMAVTFNAPHTRTSEYLFLPEDLEIIPELNGRHELPDIAWLVESIIENGQIQPVTIRKSATRPVLAAGFSRWRAVAEINRKGLMDEPLRLRCSYTQLSEEQAFLANIAENRVRNATTPIDDAHNIQRLINRYQKSIEQVATIYRASTSWVRSTLSLIELVPEAEAAVREGRVAGSAAKAIAKLSREHQKAIIAKPGKITKADLPAPKTKLGEGKLTPAKTEVPKATALTPVETLLSLADDLARLTLDENALTSELYEAAMKYKEARLK